MEAIKCEICGENKSFVFGSAKCPDGTMDRVFTIHKCANCGFVFLSPMPSRDEMAAFYFDEYYGNNSGVSGNLSATIFSLFRFLRGKRIYRYKKTGRILDVGCGDGSFLNLMKLSRWEVAGVETAETGIKRCAQKKINAQHDINFPDEYFDVITLWHSLEHIENPPGILKKLYRVLSKKGKLIISVPNIESMEYVLFKRSWFHLDLPRHLRHFSPGTLKKLLLKAGFRTLRISHYSFEYNPYGLFQTIANVFTPEFNFFYNTVKRNQPCRHQVFLNTVATLLTVVVFALPAFCFSYVFSFFKRGGVIHLYAEKIS
ncbi:MAG: hypothetical protein CVU78_01315 [Elusimicrobia bacterium HGW-Elusimicrobia-2]|nr:MAG: hypothetical protein CVU78_01315 [Elusimicrobia bacterium HGW-Elusimicrobia-2]